MRKILLLIVFLIPIMGLANDPPIRRVKRELVLTLDFIVNEDSTIMVGKKKIEMEDIPEDGHVVELVTDGNLIKKVVFEEKKK